MSRENKRKRTSWWLPVLIGSILAIAGIRYASSANWWMNFFKQGERAQVDETINTGVSVQVSDSTTNTVPAVVQSPKPVQRDDQRTEIDRSNSGRRMW